MFALAGITTSCSDFLEKEVDLTQQADNIFSDYDNTRGFLANIYTYLPDAFHGYTDGQYLNASKDAIIIRFTTTPSMPSTTILPSIIMSWTQKASVPATSS